jgi:hypothetical protein
LAKQRRLRRSGCARLADDENWLGSALAQPGIRVKEFYDILR